jgi:hypothetical protein
MALNVVVFKITDPGLTDRAVNVLSFYLEKPKPELRALLQRPPFVLFGDVEDSVVEKIKKYLINISRKCGLDIKISRAVSPSVPRVQMNGNKDYAKLFEKSPPATTRIHSRPDWARTRKEADAKTRMVEPPAKPAAAPPSPPAPPNRPAAPAARPAARPAAPPAQPQRAGGKHPVAPVVQSRTAPAPAPARPATRPPARPVPTARPAPAPAARPVARPAVRTAAPTKTPTKSPTKTPSEPYELEPMEATPVVSGPPQIQIAAGLGENFSTIQYTVRTDGVAQVRYIVRIKMQNLITPAQIGVLDTTVREYVRR